MKCEYERSIHPSSISCFLYQGSRQSETDRLCSSSALADRRSIDRAND